MDHHIRKELARSRVQKACDRCRMKKSKASAPELLFRCFQQFLSAMEKDLANDAEPTTLHVNTVNARRLKTELFLEGDAVRPFSSVSNAADA